MSISISICMATYNGSRYLSAQLESILEQIDQDSELIIVDDCSIDNTIEVIRRYTDCRIKVVLNKTNLGHVRAFERAIELSSGDYILFADQDDVWSGDHVVTLTNKLSEIEGPGLVYGDFLEFLDQSEVDGISYSWQFPKGLRTNLQFFKLLVLGRTRMFGCCMGINRKLANLSLPFPRKLSTHDLWLGYLACIYGTVLSTSKVITHRRLHDSNVTTTRRNIFYIVADRFYFIQKALWR